jgi:hypothetical protein
LEWRLLEYYRRLLVGSERTVGAGAFGCREIVFKMVDKKPLLGVVVVMVVFVV